MKKRIAFGDAFCPEYVLATERCGRGGHSRPVLCVLESVLTTYLCFIIEHGKGQCCVCLEMYQLSFLRFFRNERKMGKISRGV